MSVVTVITNKRKTFVCVFVLVVGLCCCSKVHVQYTISLNIHTSPYSTVDIQFPIEMHFVIVRFLWVSNNFQSGFKLIYKYIEILSWTSRCMKYFWRHKEGAILINTTHLVYWKLHGNWLFVTNIRSNFEEKSRLYGFLY